MKLKTAGEGKKNKGKGKKAMEYLTSLGYPSLHLSESSFNNHYSSFFIQQKCHLPSSFATR